MQNDFEEFCKNFDIVENAMQMRCLMRWNGRDLRNRENLAEHTHLVIACVIYLMDKFKAAYDLHFDHEAVIKYAMLHDSLELLRGDILSITKDVVPGLREYTDFEEDAFEERVIKIKLTDCEREVIHLADLMACYKFVEYELRFPSNDFARNVYKICKDKFDKRLEEFKYSLGGLDWSDDCVSCEIQDRFAKGYKDDAGCDIILDEDVTFMPMSTTVYNLNVSVTPKEGEMSFLCSRTSAAAKGLVVAMCPIDPNFNGNVTAIVHNISNSIIEYKKGEEKEEGEKIAQENGFPFYEASAKTNQNVDEIFYNLVKEIHSKNLKNVSETGGKELSSANKKKFGGCCK